MTVVGAYEPCRYPWLVSLQYGSDAACKEDAAREVVELLRSGGEVEVQVFAVSEGFPHKVRVAP